MDITVKPNNNKLHVDNTTIKITKYHLKHIIWYF